MYRKKKASLMSDTNPECTTSKLIFRSVNGSIIKLEEDGNSNATNRDNVIKFVLRNEVSLNATVNLLLLCICLLLWITLKSSIPLVITGIILALKCKYLATTTTEGTLLAIEYVGVHVKDKKLFSCFDSCEFLPWDTIEDIFISEVITGVTKGIVLSYVGGEGICRQKRLDKIGTFVSKSNTGKKMPGIHVRTVSQLDWLEQGKESLLTVPGSYWLCHKKNIYKFTFRYHRTCRCSEEFKYGKELMKIIRRIIKCQPRQGQQFGTQHLLVTYNHTSWTRQDKMFAILKFRERTDASAFSRAFVLTIKIFNPSEDMFSYPVESSCKRDSPCSESEEKESAVEYINTYPEREENVDKILTRSSLKNLESISKSDAEKDKSTEEVVQTDVTKESLQNQCTVHKSNTGMESPTAVDEATLDSTNLPYQYFIEKEIENSKIKNTQENMPSNACNTNNKSLRKECSSLTKHQEVTHTRVNKNDRRRSRNSKEPEKSTLYSDNIRSSDITDLVMEGLMLTIRQDQDSVSVVEQKTKLEVDEVLENSEKVETKEGEKCLLNSSLLKLENLITMIELPQDSRKKNNEIVQQSNNGLTSLTDCQRYSGLLNDAALRRQKHPHSNSTITSDMMLNETINRNEEKYNFLDNSEDMYEQRKIRKREEEELEEDIVPEALQTNIFELDNISVHRDLLMDDVDIEDSVSYRNSGSEHLSQDLSQASSHQELCLDKSNINSNHKTTSPGTSNALRIVSDERISMDELPETLRKVLHSKLSNKNCLHNSDEIKATEITGPRSVSTSPCSTDNKLYTDIPLNENIDNESIACSMEIENANFLEQEIEFDKEMKEFSDQEKSEENPSTMNTSDNENDQFVLPKKLQDITQEFYHLLQQQKKNSDRRNLRQKRKSLNNNNNLTQNEVHIDMLKFIQHITQGAKVVVKRLSAENLSAVLGKSSSLTTCIN